MGVKKINNVDPQFAAPYDSRLVVDDIASRDALITDGIGYEGLMVYVKDNGSDAAEFQMYMNTGTVGSPVLAWVPFVIGGGISIHNDLSGIQGGVSNTEHYHLTAKEAEWVTDSIPFTPPSGSLASNEGPTWVYNEIIDQPINLNGSVVQFDGVNVFARLVDSIGNHLDIEGGDEDANGWVPVVGSRILTYIFPTVPDPNTTVPVNTASINGDTALYKLEVTYDDFNDNPQSFSKILTYTATARHTDEIWYPKEGLTSQPILVVPPLGGDLSAVTQEAAAAGLESELGDNGKYIAYVISDDLTGGDSTIIKIIQNGQIVYQPGVVANNNWGVQIPYSGDTSASSAPATGFIMIYTTTLQGKNQTYNIVIGSELGN